MRIHTTHLDAAAIRLELKVEKMAGRIAPHVTFKRLTAHRSSLPGYHAFEVQLIAEEPDNGRRAGNSGSYGAMQPEHDGYAATYDEWGWLLTGLFNLDADMIVGTPKKRIYDGRTDFEEKTGLSYNPGKLAHAIQRDADEDDPGDPYPYIIGKGGGAGRRGANRADVETAYRWSYREAQNAYAKWLDNPAARTGNDRMQFKPRSLADVAEFAKLPVSALEVTR